MPAGIFKIFPRMMERFRGKMPTPDLKALPPEQPTSFAPQQIPDEAQEKEVVQWVRRRLAECVSAEKTFTDEAKENYRYLVGDHYLGKRPTDRPTIIVQKMKPKCERKIAFLTDEQWKIDLLPFEESDRESTEAMQKLHDHLWERHSVRDVLDEALIQSEWAFEGYIEPIVDLSDPEDPTVIAVAPDWFGIFRNPSAKKPKDARYWFKVTAIELADLRAEYGEKALGVKPGHEADILDNLYQEFAYGTPLVRRISEVIAKIECYVKDESVIVQENEFGEEEFIPRYRKGWRRIVVAGDVLLRDEESPFDFVGQPWTKITQYPAPHQYHGDCDVSRLKELQKELTMKRGLFMEHMEYAVGYMIVPDDTGVSPEDIWNIPGRILVPETTEKSVGLRWVHAPPLPQGIMDSFLLAEKEMDDIIGLSEPSRGKTPGADMSGRALAILKESDLPPIRKVGRQIAKALKEFAVKWLWLIGQVYDEERTIEILNPDGKGFEILELNKPTGEYKEMVGEEGQIFRAPIIKNDIRGLRYDVKIVPTSGFRIDTEDIEARALRMLEIGLITKHQYLEHVDFPGKEKIMEQHDENARLRAAVAAMEKVLMQLEQVGKIAPEGAAGAPPAEEIRAPLEEGAEMR